jgi:hypothetical protein
LIGSTTTRDHKTGRLVFKDDKADLSVVGAIKGRQFADVGTDFIVTLFGTITGHP